MCRRVPVSFGRRGSARSVACQDHAFPQGRGGQSQADVRYSSGALKAWLSAYAHLLISWKPFHFRVGIGISLGASRGGGPAPEACSRPVPRPSRGIASPGGGGAGDNEPHAGSDS
ncbi:DUF6603 domain-containing protein [Embleya sp. NPDC005575]|uniref:DUF6603 domain-containing protein n=1 Tax=Embleya sp. NPDC005575 TaxID=3156892 RepID=UPI0033A31679